MFWVIFYNPGVRQEKLLSKMFKLRQFFSILAIENSKAETYS